jgi:hypothetical protein
MKKSIAGLRIVALVSGYSLLSDFLDADFGIVSERGQNHV